MGERAGLECWNCGTSLDALPVPLSRHEHCPKCFEALHCCRLCRHFRADETISCREDRADPPTIKENANFCDWFKPRSGAGPENQRDGSAKARLDALFGKDADSAGTADTSAAAADKNEAARAKLDALFGGADENGK